MIVGNSQYNIVTLVADLKNVIKVRNEVEGSRNTDVMKILDSLIKENSIQGLIFYKIR